MLRRNRGCDDTASAEDLLPWMIRRIREERELSRADLARITGYSRRYIDQLEQPSRGIPARPVLAAVDAALAADGALVALRLAAIEARTERTHSDSSPEIESRRRIRDLLDYQACDRKLDALDRRATELIASAQQLSPADITVRVRGQQRFADVLLRTRMLPHQQFRLFMIAGHLAGLQAIALLDSNEFEKAGTCCLEAAVFAELTGHEGLRAWILVVNNLIDAAVHGTRTDHACPAFPTPDEFASMIAAADYRTTAGAGKANAAGVPTPDWNGPRLATARAHSARPPVDFSRAFRPPV